MAQSPGIQQLGNYRLVKKLGEGGMGAVYLADDLNLNRRVAIKVLPKKFTSDQQLSSRFRREAKAAGQLNHMNIVGAFAVGEDQGFLFYVMEFCEGEPLDAYLKRVSQMDVTEALNIVQQTAAGLQYAHERNIIHRDIKPANIILTSDGTAKILDLGLSKKLGDSGVSYNTVTGVALGTPYYISPEQARGEPDIDGRADIYSLGATLYHFLIGRPPFEGSSAAVVMAKHLSEPFPNPADARPDLPPGIAHIVLKATCKVPAERYRDCAELLADIERVKAGQAPLSQLPAAVKRTGKVTKPIGRRGGPSERLPAERPDKAPPVLPIVLVLCAVVIGGLVLLKSGAPPENSTVAVTKTPETPSQPSTPAPLQTPRQPSSAAPPSISKGPGTISEDTPVSTPPANPAPPQSPAPAVYIPKPEDLALSHAIDILPAVDIEKDKVDGAWRRDGKSLLVTDGKMNKIEIPYTPPEEYDLRVNFTRMSGQADVVLTLTAGGKQFCWMMGGILKGRPNAIFGFDLVDGKFCNENETTVVADNCLNNGARHDAVLRVRKDGITAILDGRQIKHVPTNYANFSMRPGWALKNTNVLGLGSFFSSVAFHSVEVLEVTGRGTFLRPAEKIATDTATYLYWASWGLYHPARWKNPVDLLPLVDLKKDVMEGEWRPEAGGLAVKKADGTNRPRLTIPYKPPEEYDLRVVFTRVEGSQDVDVILSQHGKPFQWVMGWGDVFFGFDTVKSARANRNSTTAQRAGLLHNGRRHTLLLRVRQSHLTAAIDGVELFSQEVNFAEFALAGDWHMNSGTYLGLGATVSAVFHSVELSPIKGTGAPTRPDDPAAKALLAKAANAPADAPVAAVAPPAPPPDAKIEYEKVLQEVYAHLDKGADKDAAARLERALAEPPLAPMKTALTRDLECVGYPADVRQALAKGVAALGEQPFTLVLPKTKETLPVGKGKPNSIVGVKGEFLQVSMTNPQGVRSVSFASLDDATRNALIDLGLAAIPDGKLKQAFTWVLDLRDEKAAHTAAQVRELLDDAAKSGTDAQKIAHVKGRLDAHELELAAKKDLPAIDRALRAQEPEEAVKLLAEFKKNYGGTLAWHGAEADIMKRINAMTVPGLWVGYYTGDDANHFKTLRQEGTTQGLEFKFGAARLDPRMAGPNTAFRARGMLRVEKEGGYQFSLEGHGYVKLVLNKQVLYDATGSPVNDITKVIPLKPGDYSLTIEYVRAAEEDPGLMIKWHAWARAPYESVPAAVLTHEAAKREQYAGNK